METENGSNERIGLRVTAYCNMGSRKYMEDTFSVAYQKSDNGKDLDYAFFGIFDGHGGDTASIFAKNHLMNYIVDQPGFWSNHDKDVLDAIKKGFLECHMAMWKDLDKWPQTASGLPSTAGTTASVAFLRKGKLYIGHCGDSGIVLGRTNPKGGKWISQPLTVEHKPENPDELARIESDGGKVQQKQGIHRVVWYRPKNPHQGPIRRNTRIEEVPFLAVARSLGDLWSYNYKTEKFVVSPEPDVDVIDVDAHSFKCLIFASDGLWNVLDPDFSVDSVYETERRNDHNAKLGINAWRNPSRILVETALEKWRSNGLRADNTSVVCVMLDPPNKRNMFKFCRSPNTEYQQTTIEDESARTIYDYSTSEAYNLDYVMTPDIYSGGLTRQNAFYGDNQFYQPVTTNLDERYLGSHQNHHYSNGYNSYESPFGYEVASTSQQHAQHQNIVESGALTYQASSNESAFVKACCRNNFLLANPNEPINYHSTYEQHREMYENMALRPYPPLHYAYRPVPTIPTQQPLPSLHTNIYDHQGYLQSAPVYKPMERYNYLRPTPEEVEALHNEEEEENDSGSDTDVMDFSDEESDEIENKDVAVEETKEVESENCDDSIQIFEISSSSVNEVNDRTIQSEDMETSENEAEFREKPVKSNNKENNDEIVRRKKVTASTGRFYATRQFERMKMKSDNASVQTGVKKAIGKQKLHRRITRNIRKVVKALSDQKPSTTTIKKFDLLTDLSQRGSKKIVTKDNGNKSSDKDKVKASIKPRVLRSAQVKEVECTTTKLNSTVKEVRSLRSNATTTNVIATRTFEKPATRQRTSAFFENGERSNSRRLK
ncbi:CLUMA_CG017971, isoform A [Clunio marinus]|uniref:CLUMA_CG017971, isoform A n=1 Tax=Clunio marinus TaxID=568069 RepID=A0A1J1IZ50_9DIPT|nr:CLUMA_CG017971, isoform A [Clunio marinus]